MGSYFLRSDEMNRRYSEHKNKVDAKNDNFSDRAERTVQEFKYWLIIQNIFPYDLISSVHHLLIPKRPVPMNGDILPEEKDELLEIRKVVAPNYDCIIENFPRNQSVPGQFHYHLVTFKQIH